MRALRAFIAVSCLVFASVAYAGFGIMGGGEGRIIVYGDSMSNAFNPESCEWCDPLTGSGLQVWAMARGGARSYYDAVTDDWCRTGTAAVGVDCDLHGEYQAEYIEGACQVSKTRWAGDGGGPTCAIDLPLSSQDVNVFFFGTNDLRAFATVAQWDATYQPLSETAFGVMLDASETAGNHCVVVLGPPTWHLNQADPLDSDIKLVKLHDFLRAEVAANRPTCAIADVYSAFRAIETDFGSQALYDMYSNCDAGPGDADCIHPIDGPTGMGFRPNDLMGEVILDAIRDVHRIRLDAPSGAMDWGDNWGGDWQ